MNVLFHFESPAITVAIKVFFENEDLVVEHYDLGKRVWKNTSVILTMSI